MCVSGSVRMSCDVRTGRAENSRGSLRGAVETATRSLVTIVRLQWDRNLGSGITDLYTGVATNTVPFRGDMLSIKVFLKTTAVAYSGSRNCNITKLFIVHIWHTIQKVLSILN
jgi:hypothetical protein